MANVRLLRQQLQDYQRKLQSANKGYSADYNAYKGQVDAYNADIDALKGGATYVVKDPTNKAGGYALAAGLNSGGGPKTTKPVYVVSGNPTELGIPRSTRGATPGMRYDKNTGNLYSAVSGKWVVVANYKMLPDATPTPPDEQDAPKAPSFTEKDKKLLQNPTANPAEMTMAAAKGVIAQSSLAGEQPHSATSAFANPEDPNNLKEKGVLARVLGGQL